ncbi:hypothetical protein ATK17_3993 [Branchiibius hedensis]|uniref:Uncharacterized protein n=1 Tax=Branchiibius hedensis TaxID=672460 RepID=A0A2Y9BQ31_9MICO|nr:hypothetical protein ATK17_3993 [Branchiibius hedensis]SSA59172.1 hypothetical protein SAMN04489750_3993 [Branchiibius hedensis]
MVDPAAVATERRVTAPPLWEYSDRITTNGAVPAMVTVMEAVVSADRHQ